MGGNFRHKKSYKLFDLFPVLKPDNQLQSRQHVHRHPGVQQALVLVQLIKIHSRFITYLLKIILDSSSH
jgi:hypothetical protein